jgi:hypothetical protein
MSSPISIDQIFNSESIAKSGSATYDFDISRGNGYEGFFSLQLQIVSGAGEVTVDFLESNDGENFVDQGAASDMVTGLSGAGHTMYSFDPMVCKQIRIRVTETGGVAGVVINAWLAAQ